MGIAFMMCPQSLHLGSGQSTLASSQSPFPFGAYGPIAPQHLENAVMFLMVFLIAVTEIGCCTMSFRPEQSGSSDLRTQVMEPQRAHTQSLEKHVGR